MATQHKLLQEVKHTRAQTRWIEANSIDKELDFISTCSKNDETTKKSTDLRV